MKLLVLDTSVVMHVLGDSAPRGQEQQAADAVHLLSLTDQYVFAITTPTVAELLVHVRDESRLAVVGELERSFQVYAFDTAAAVIAARLWNGRLKGKNAGDRQVVKVDLQIAATAIRWDAKAFCTFEDQQKKRIQAVAPSVTAGAPIVFLPGQKRLPF